MEPQKYDIDLGDDVKINVKYNGTEYALREPSVAEVDGFRAKSDKSENINILVDFLVKLGMPHDIVMKMGMSKATKLIEGLMDLLTKKK